MKRMPELNQSHLQLWLEMLADGELDVTQSEGLFNYLDRAESRNSDPGEESGGSWRQLALTLLHEKTIRREMTRGTRASDEMPTGLTAESSSHNWTIAGSLLQAVVPSKPNGPAKLSGTGKSNYWRLAMAAAFAFVLGLWTHSVLDTNRQNLAMPNEEPSGRTIHQREITGVTEFSYDGAMTYQPYHDVGFRSAARSMTLYEIEDTPTRASFYMNCKLPDVLLQALVLSGYSVKIEEDALDLEAEDGEQIQIPVAVLHIEKYASMRF